MLLISPAMAYKIHAIGSPFCIAENSAESIQNNWIFVKLQRTDEEGRKSDIEMERESD